VAVKNIVTYYEGEFVALGIQHAKRMRRITCNLRAVQLYFNSSLYLTNGTIFGKKSSGTQNSLSLQISSEIFIAVGII
jgi:hypothetical protein